LAVAAAVVMLTAACGVHISFGKRGGGSDGAGDGARDGARDGQHAWCRGD
jgi:hypothetical protein